MRRFYLLLLIFNFAAAIQRPLLAQSTEAVAALRTEVTTSSTVSAHALQIAAGDLLDINVFDTPELSGKLRVDERGHVSLPIAGDFTVAGLTAPEASRAIESKLLGSDVLKDPHVSVTILEYATQGVTVLGEVKNPGVYPLLGSHNLLDLVSAAGGVTANAGKAVTITHRGAHERPVILNMEGKAGSDAAFNLDVRPGDTILVSHAGIVYVLGDVGKPGGFLLENNGRLTALQAIALAQGTNRTASLSKAKLLRKTDDGHEEESVPLEKILANKAPDPALGDGDVLYVPSSAAKNTLRAVEAILPAVAGAAIYRVP
jgi:polysaccharide export outer membrane protein